LLHSVYDQPAADAVHAQFERILDALTDKLPQVAAHLDAARTDILAFTASPKSGVAANLFQQSLSAEPGDPARHRRGRHLPGSISLIRLAGAVLAEQHDEWTEQRRYLGLDILAKSQHTKITNDSPTSEEVTISAITA
jgi:putative transposase